MQACGDGYVGGKLVLFCACFWSSVSYIRNEIKSFIKNAAKIAEALEVSLDYLVGSSSVIVKDKKMLYRLELLEKISQEDKNTILKVVDSYLKEAQLNSTQNKLQ